MKVSLSQVLKSKNSRTECPIYQQLKNKTYPDWAWSMTYPDWAWYVTSSPPADEELRIHQNSIDLAIAPDYASIYHV